MLRMDTRVFFNFSVKNVKALSSSTDGGLRLDISGSYPGSNQFEFSLARLETTPRKNFVTDPKNLAGVKKRRQVGEAVRHV